jgi:ornithine cyclodeaminase/alanine dehydrogenase-like protein (mu-crystallin family)
MITPGKVTMPSSDTITLLNREEVRGLLNWSDLMDATKNALIEVAAGGANRTQSTQLIVPGASLHLKAGALEAAQVMSVKANLRPDAGSTSGAILAFDLAQRRLQAVMASGDLTSMRTAAIAAVSAQALLPSSSTPVTILGTGPVAQRVSEVLVHLRLADEIRVWSRHHDRAVAFAAASEQQVAHKAHAEVGDAVQGAKLVVTCTPSREPLVQAGDLLEDAVILAMGADSPGKRELPADLMEHATVYADVRSDAVKVGESAYLTDERAERVTDIGLLLDQDLPRSSEGRVVLDSVGSSAVDAAVVALVLQEATRQGVGTPYDLNANA